MMRCERKWIKFRVIAFLSLFIILFAILLYEAFRLQIISGGTLQKLARKQHIKSIQLQPERGFILDCNGDKLAASIMMDSICADPTQIDDAQTVAARLAEALNENRQAILNKMNQLQKFLLDSSPCHPGTGKSRPGPQN